MKSWCNVSLGVGAGRECEIGAREYKYVAGDTREYGGEDESERNISTSNESGFLQLSCIVHWDLSKGKTNYPPKPCMSLKKLKRRKRT